MNQTRDILNVYAGACADGHHVWEWSGGANCGCEPEGCCSIPVYQCTRCWDYDYGVNEEARKIRADCAEWKRENLHDL